MNLGSFGFGSGGGTPSGMISGGGSVPKIPKFTAASVIGDSQMSDNGTTVFIGASATSSSALFEVNSTTQGVLFPRVTTAQRNAITVNAAANSLFIFNTTIGQYQYYDHTTTSWKTIDNGLDGIYSGSGTVPAGTTATITDYIAFNGGEFRTENGYWQGTSKILYINPNGTTANLFVGQSSGNSTMTGTDNTGLGYQALLNNTSGYWNTAFGTRTLEFNTSGLANTALGRYSLLSLTTGQSCTSVGCFAGQNMTTAIGNVALGVSVLNLTTTGSYNTGMGDVSLNKTNGNFNTAIGRYSMREHLSGDGNTALGEGSLFTNTTGLGNVCLGYNSGYYETGSNKLFIDNTARANEADGRAKALVYGIFDAAVANQKLYINANEGKFGQINIYSDTSLNNFHWNSTTMPSIPSGSRNTLIGNNDTGTLGLTTGTHNFLGGAFSSVNLTTGARNILIGTYSTPNLIDGNDNIFLGNSTTTLTSVAQSLAFNGEVRANNQVVFGDPDRARYSSFYFGQGIDTPDSYGKFDVNFFATSNQAGETDKNATVSNFYINGSKGTGTGVGGNVVIRTAPFGATGSTQNTLINAFSVLGSGDIDTPITHYNYMAASNSADTVGDVRFYATYVATVSSFIIEKCTVANATKGGGTWVNINSFSL